MTLDRVSNKEHHYGKNHAEDVHQNLVPHPFLVNNPKQPLHARNSPENEIF